MTSDQSFDSKLRAVVQDVGESSPPPPPFPFAMRLAEGRALTDEPEDYVSAPHIRRSRSSKELAAVGAIVAVALVVGVVALFRSREATAPVASGHTVEVEHQVIQYEQRAAPSCPDFSQSGRFDSMTFETWADPISGKWRQDVTYPDGSKRSVIVSGDPTVPTSVYNLGGWNGTRGTEYQCGATGIMLAEPGQNNIFLLTTTAYASDTNPSIDGQRVPGDHTDSLGRTAELWQSEASGADESGPIAQSSSWYIDPQNHTVFERQRSSVSSYSGTYESTATLVIDDRVTVDEGFLDTSSYEQLRDPQQ